MSFTMLMPSFTGQHVWFKELGYTLACWRLRHNNDLFLFSDMKQIDELDTVMNVDNFSDFQTALW
mgnify:CR=1 FL=1